MPTATQGNDREEIRLLLNKLNDAWRSGNTEQLDACFHEGVVFKGPNLAEMGRGREACVTSYQDFLRQATVRDFQWSEPVIDVWGNAAVASYSWQIRYEMNAKAYDEPGQEVFVLIRDRDRWKAVWRAVLSLPPST